MKSNLYHVISPTTNLSIYFSPHLAEAIAYAESHLLVDIHGDDGSRWKYKPHAISKERNQLYWIRTGKWLRDYDMVMVWNRLDQEPLSEKFSKWLDQQYEKYLSGQPKGDMLNG